MNAQDLFDQAFQAGRDPRSPEYRAGVLAALRYRCKETARIQTPYKIGTAQADAWFAGVDEGHLRYRAAVEAETLSNPATFFQRG